MAATITWELYKYILREDTLSVTIRELTDGVPTVVKTLEDGTKIYITHEVSMHKSHSEEDFRKLLKNKVLADRSKKTEETTQALKFDFSTFEDYVNS